MDLHEAIYSRRTVRDFSSQPVPADVVERALNAGLHAPSHNHQKEWHFVLAEAPEAKQAIVRAENRNDVVDDDTPKRFAKYEPLAQKMYLDAIPKQNRMILSAPAVLVMVFKPTPMLFNSTAISHMNCLAAAWCCIQNILLSFAGDGVCGVTLVPHNTRAIVDALSIPPDLEIAAVIPFGYKAPDATILENKEVAARERLHRNLW